MLEKTNLLTCICQKQKKPPKRKSVRHSESSLVALQGTCLPGSVHWLGYVMINKESRLYPTIFTLYEQQKYMYEKCVHTMVHRIVIISQPWLRPIIRGKANTPIEFGANQVLNQKLKKGKSIKIIGTESE